MDSPGCGDAASRATRIIRRQFSGRESRDDERGSSEAQSRLFTSPRLERASVLLSLLSGRARVIATTRR